MSYLFDQPSIAKRTGEHDRVNTDRFFHIMNEGWFVYLRKDKILIDNINSKNGVAGPFESKPLAGDYLKQIIHMTSSEHLEPTEGPNANQNEDWRY